MERIDCVVIGAGVVGLAVARELALRGRETLILEAAEAIGSGVSSRNSEVIHAGLYYPRGSLKATLCVQGRDRLYAFCEAFGVPYRRCGKLVVATHASQMKALGELAGRAAENGVLDLLPLSRGEAQALEPALECAGALYSPSTGIVDTHQLMLALLGDAEGHGAMCALRTPVEAIEVADGARFVVRTGGAEPARLAANLVVNSAGLGAQALARRIAGLDPRWVPPQYFARGNYFSLSGRAPFSHLVYPMPERAGLGVHLTLDLAGQARFGPDVEWIDQPRYEVDPARADAFYGSIRAYWPGLPDGALQPAYAGVRPKISGPGEPAADFMIQGAAQHGVRGLVNLFGIESPGLTAALAIARRVADMAARSA
jgi:L-2-hydroxyglutarate oxidase LhgO